MRTVFELCSMAEKMCKNSFASNRKHAGWSHSLINFIQIPFEISLLLSFFLFILFNTIRCGYILKNNNSSFFFWPCYFATRALVVLSTASLAAPIIIFLFLWLKFMRWCSLHSVVRQLCSGLHCIGMYCVARRITTAAAAAAATAMTRVCVCVWWEVIWKVTFEISEMIYAHRYVTTAHWYNGLANGSDLSPD